MITMAFAISISKKNTLIKELPDDNAVKNFIASIDPPYFGKSFKDSENNHVCDIITPENGDVMHLIIHENNHIELQKRVPGGVLNSAVYYEPYAGIDIEYTSDNENSNTDEPASRPGVLMEKPDEANTLRALIWDGLHEDYISETRFAEYETVINRNTKQ